MFYAYALHEGPTGENNNKSASVSVQMQMEFKTVVVNATQRSPLISSGRPLTDDDDIYAYHEQLISLIPKSHVYT